MSHTIPKKPEQSIKGVLKAAHDAASADGMALHRLTNIVKLAAFASEARRTLTGIDDALIYQTEERQVIDKRVRASSNWAEIDDAVGEVLQDVAAQLGALNEAMSNRPFELQKLLGIHHE